MKNTNLFIITIAGLLLFSCSVSDEPINSEEFKLNITFIMDSNAVRLDNFGNPVAIQSGNAAQDPDFRTLGVHYIGLYPNEFTPYENGIKVFSSPITEEGGSKAIDFKNELFITEENNKISVSLKSINSGTYKYLRSSIGFQKYKIIYNLGGASTVDPNWPNGLSDDIDIDGTLASFVGYNTYINNYSLKTETVNVNANKTQGYYGLESNGNILGYQFNKFTEGIAPQTTVSNPIFATSPIPTGSCIVTGKFLTSLVIPENPTQDINIQVIISINNSFEWKDINGNGKFEPLLGEQVIDMGTRGIFPSIL